MYIASSTQSVKSHRSIKWWVDKQNYWHNRIVFSNKNKAVECSRVWIKFKNIMLRTILCIFLLLWNEQKIQIDKHTKQICDCLGLDFRAGITKMGLGYIFLRSKMFKDWVVESMSNSVQLLYIIGLYTYSRWFSWYAIYT